MEKGPESTSKGDSKDVSAQPKLSPEQQKAYDLMFSKHYVLTGIILGYVIGSLALFAGAGYLLDQQFGTSPKFLAAGVILSFIATQILLYKRFRS